MKKRIIVIIMSIATFAVSLFGLSGCVFTCLHTWDEGKITKAATCTEDGKKVFSCTLCRETKTETLLANGHVIEEETVTKEATCGEDGEKQGVCTVCEELVAEAVPATGEHSYDEGEVVKAATCIQTGVMKYTCTVCQFEKEEDVINEDGHEADKGEVLKEPTCTEEGLGRYSCTLCGEEFEKAIPVLPVAYSITMEGYGEFLVPESGKYALKAAEKVGYHFIKWVDENGNDFAPVGTVKKDITVKPVFNLADTTTVEELEQRAAGGVDYIKITQDIVVDRTIYLFHKTVIYADKDVTLTRAATFAGDMFVIGQDKDGKSHVLTNGSTKVAFGKQDALGTITVDGNSEKTTVNVVGSALFIVNGSIVDMYDGVSFVNHTKVGNERILSYQEYIGSTKGRVGGAGAIIVSGSFTMHGGLFENNVVNTVNVGSAQSEDESYYVSSYGGAIYNCGTFTMQGGAIKNNVANRGGAIFTQKIVKLQSGVVEGNYAENKGGAICAWETSNCDTIIGTETAARGSIVLKDNVAKVQGGAILSYGVSPIVVLGGARFEGNKAETATGGVISTTGPITVYNSEFIDNYAFVSGGTIYQTYEGEGKQPHTVTLEGCLFEGNTAGRGGVMLISAVDDVKKFTALVINDCVFKNNSAHYRLVDVTDKETGETTQKQYYGSGGAIYVTKGTSLKIDNSTFESNTAELSAGAVYVTTDTQTTITNSTFCKNEAVNYGGAVYAGSAKSLSISYCTFTQNGAIQNGAFTTERGAGIYATDTPVKALQCQYVGNNASYGAAVYVAGSASYTDQASNASKTSLFENNRANRGGAIALYGTVEISFAEFKGNTATQHGGAVYLGTNAVLTVNQSTFSSNTVTVANVDVDEKHFGGAIAAINGSVTANDCTFSSNTLTAEAGQNTFKLYGGGVGVSGQSIISIRKSTFTENAAGYGGAVSALGLGGNTFEAVDITLNKNSSTNCGAGIYVNAATATLENVTAKENTSKNGGAIYASDCVSLTIKGESTFEKNTASGSGGGVYFTKGTLSVTGASFTENSGIEGGAIRVIAAENNPATVQITNVGFGKNTSTNGGGGVYVTDGEVTITESTFTQNQAGSNGGAISFMRADVEFKDTTFEGNTASAAGGGVYTTQSNGEMQTKTVSCLFKNNTATENGGAVYTTSTGKHVDENSTFISNSAKNGGAMHLYGAITLTGSMFTENTATDGGAIYASKGTLTLTNASFTENTASGNGGVLYVTAGVKAIDNGSSYQKANAVNGGAVYISATTSDQTVGGEYTATGVSFTKNTASGNGGGICVYNNASVNLTNVSLIANTANGNGGALWTYTGSLTQIQGIEAKGNHADGNGGVMYTRGNFTVRSGENVTNVFGGTQAGEANTSGAEGGAIRVLATEGIASVIQMDGVSFICNTSTKGGGAMYVTESEVTISASTFTQNQAGANGGAITFYKTNAQIQNTTFDGNTATTDGGAIYTTQSNGGVQTKTVSCTFVRNSSNRGGAVYTTGTGKHVDENSTFDTNHSAKGGALHTFGEAVLTGSMFTENTATNGGAIYVSKGTLTLTNASFTKNTASENGGAMYLLVGTTATDEGSTFTGNTATNGGAVYTAAIEEDETVGTVYSITDASFMENTATSGGGGVYFTDGTLSVTGATFKGNSALEGGAIRVTASEANPALITVRQSNFEENSTTSGGGAIYVTEGDVTMTNNQFIRNQAAKNGGCITFMRADVQMTECTFDGNQAGGNGGTIYTTQSGTSAKQSGTNTHSCTFKNNTASGNGGAIYVTGTGKHVDDKSTFDSNTAANGGAAYNPANGTLTLGGSTVKNNTATLGGGLYSASTTTLTNVTFTSNTSKNGGGAIYAYGGKTTVTGGSMTKNVVTSTATYSDMGGAIGVAKSTTVTVSGVTFTENNGGASGGAIAAYGANAVATVENCSFTANKASNGGTFYVGGAGAVTLTGVTVKGSTASGLGAVAYTTSGSASTLTVNSITLYNNCTDKNTKTSYGFVYLNNAKNVLNIHKGNFVLKDAQTEATLTVSSWSTLIWNKVNATVNELTA